MRFITFLFLFVAFSANCQPNKQKIEYTIDLITSDSFYLIERIFVLGSSRPDTSIRHMFFSDTSEFRLYIERVERDASRKEREYLQAKVEFDSLYSRVKKLEKIAKDDIGMTGFKPAKKDVIVPDVLDGAEGGFWVIYPIRGRYRNIEYVENVTDIKKEAGLLSKNGTIISIKGHKK